MVFIPTSCFNAYCRFTRNSFNTHGVIIISLLIPTNQKNILCSRYLTEYTYLVQTPLIKGLSSPFLIYLKHPWEYPCLLRYRKYLNFIYLYHLCLLSGTYHVPV
jgi:hypothetical protein